MAPVTMWEITRRGKENRYMLIRVYSGCSDSSEWLIESFSRAFVPHWPVSYNHIVAIFIPRSGIVLRTYRYNYLNGNRRMEWFAASEVQWRLRLTILISFFSLFNTNQFILFYINAYALILWMLDIHIRSRGIVFIRIVASKFSKPVTINIYNTKRVETRGLKRIIRIPECSTPPWLTTNTTIPLRSFIPLEK